MDVPTFMVRSLIFKKTYIFYSTFQNHFFLVICALKPKAGGNKAIVKQEREISEADWIPVDDFLKNGSGEFFYLTRLNIQICFFYDIHLKSNLDL